MTPDPINGRDHRHISTTHTVKGTPSSDTGRVTLKDLDRFVSAARTAGVPGHTEVRAQITWTGLLKSVEVTG